MKRNPLREIKKDKDGRNNKNNNIKTQREKPKTVNILGNGMVKKLNDHLLTKKVKQIYLFKVRSFSGVKVSSMIDHVKQTIQEDK